MTGILHIDMDAFFASVELLRHPEHRGKPAVVAHDGPRSVVTSATYEARALGVRSAMPLSFAKRAVPDLIVLEPHRPEYVRYSKEVMEIFREFTPLVEPLSIDEAFLDVRGARRLYGEPESIAHSIRTEVANRTGLTCSVGVAATKFIAKIASDMAKPNGLLVVPESETLTFLRPLPIRRLWGVGAETAKVLENRGLFTVADVADTPVSSLTAALGELAGKHLHDLANGHDPRQVTPERSEKSMGREHTFSTDVTDRSRLLEAFLDQSHRVGRALRAAGLVARTVSIKLTFADFRSITRSRTLAEPTCVSREIFAVASDLLDVLNLDLHQRPVRLGGVRAQSLIADSGQTEALWDSEAETWRKAEEVIDGLADRFGAGVVKPATLLDRPGKQRTSTPNASSPD